MQAARELGVRIVASRGSMDLGVSDGGLPPDELVEELDAVLAETERLAALLHEPGPGARVQLAVAPCSPFSVTGRLMEESAALARRLGLPLHTHLAETLEEEAYCIELYGCRPVEYLDRLGWLADDVWCAHCVHLSEADIAQFASTGTGVAHCPTSNLRLGAGVAPVRDMLDAGMRVGLGVDGSASNERSDLFLEVKQALLVARGRGGGTAMTARDAIRLGTRGGAAVLRRDDIGSLEPGKCADFAVWRTDGLELGGADDLVAGHRLRRPASRRPAGRRRRGGRARRRARQRRRGRDRAGPSSPSANVHGMSASLSTHVLDTAAGQPAAGVTRRAAARRRAVARAETDADGRARARRGARARALPARLPSAVAVLPPGRARARARCRRPLPRAAPRLPVLVRELPRQLTAEELAELFEGRTRFVELLAERDDPLEHAPDGDRTSSRTRRSARCSTPIPRSGRRTGLSARSAAEQGADADPEVLAELARLNAEYEARHGFRFVVFVNRRPKAEILEVLRVRIDNPTDAELETALGELVAIATDRWRRG